MKKTSNYVIHPISIIMKDLWTFVTSPPPRTARRYPPAIPSASVNHGASSARHRGLLGGRAERRGEDPRRDARAAQRRVGPAVDALDRRSTWTSYFWSVKCSESVHGRCSINFFIAHCSMQWPREFQLRAKIASTC